MTRRIATSKRLRKPVVATIPWEDHLHAVFNLPSGAIPPKSVSVRHNLKSSTMVCEFTFAGLKWRSTMRIPREALK